MASQPLAQGPLSGAPVTRLDFSRREFVKAPSPEKEEATRVEVNLAALDIHGLAEGAPAPTFPSKMMVGADTPCRKSLETGKECKRRLEQVDDDGLFDLLKSRQPALPVPVIRSNHDEHYRKAVQALQNIRDFEWDILTQYSIYGHAYVWTCECDQDDDEEAFSHDGVDF